MFFIKRKLTTPSHKLLAAATTKAEICNNVINHMNPRSGITPNSAYNIGYANIPIQNLVAYIGGDYISKARLLDCYTFYIREEQNKIEWK